MFAFNWRMEHTCYLHMFSEVVVHFSTAEVASSGVQLFQWVRGGRYTYALVVVPLNYWQPSHILCCQWYLMSIYSSN